MPRDLTRERHARLALPDPETPAKPWKRSGPVPLTENWKRPVPPRRAAPPGWLARMLRSLAEALRRR